MSIRIKQDINNKGFTLIELLVVISIIAILSVMGITIYGVAQQNARDGRRNNDLNAIVKAIEANRTPGSAYYTKTNAAGDTSIAGALMDSQFVGGATPVDSTTAKYCIAPAVSGSAIQADPTAATWPAAQACPNTQAAVGTTGVNGQWSIVVDSYLFPLQTTGWKVCARLENNTISCEASAQ